MNEFKITPIEKNGQRVLTTARLAEAYGTDSDVISKNFNNNKSRYIEGVHFYRLTGDELKAFFATVNFTVANSSKIRTLYLWTERGALLHAKSLNTDKAWEVYEFLVDNYFRTRNISEFSDNVLIQIFENQKIMQSQINALTERLENESVNINDLIDYANNITIPCIKYIIKIIKDMK